MQLSVNLLERVTSKLFEHLKRSGVETIDLSIDLYWNIPEPELYKMNDQPKNLNVGQLADDWSILQKIADGAYDPVTYNFVALAAILRAVGETIGD